MTAHSGSILRKLQLGFALSAMLLAGALALFMDNGLRRALHVEDLADMRGHAKLLQDQLASGIPLHSPRTTARPEKVDWRVIDQTGRILAQSPDLEDFPALPTGGPMDRMLAFRTEQGVYSVLLRPWSREGERGLIQVVIDQTHSVALSQQFRRTLLLGVLAAAVAAALLARFIARWGLEPLNALIQETAAINDRNLQRRLATENFPLELQELVATLNAALARLQAAFERLGSLGAELAHELRTPLQVLRSTLENRVLQTGGRPIDPADLGSLIEECDRMAELIEQILFLARSERAPVELTTIECPVAELLEEVRGFFEAVAEENGVTLAVAGGPDLRLRGDPLLLTRALHNLVSNALRHTPQGGTVQLGAWPAGESLAEVWVSDTGPGIPATWVPHLGTPFARLPGGTAPAGHGLGLAIVKRIAAMLGGSLTIHSQEGSGTRMVLKLPCS